MSATTPSTDRDAQIPVDDDGEVTLPIVELLTGRGFITGKSGSGKSNSASVIVEELLDREHAVLIVDIDGEYYGLKEEHELLHVGADEEADVQVGPEHAEKLATLALDANVPIILDVSGFLEDDARDEMVAAVASALFDKEKKLKRPFALFVEEIHEFVPEGGLGDVGKQLVRIGKRGRKRGLGLVGMSQRPADVKKDFITQCDWLCWHRLTWENDTKVVRRVLGSTYEDAVQDLDDGEAFLMADWDEEIRRVQFRRKHTFDAGATPGLDDIERPDLKSVSSDLVDELQQISEEQHAREDRIAKLERRLDEKDETIATLEDDLEAARQNNETVQQLADQLADISAGEGGAEALEEIREEKNAEIRSLTHTVSDREATIEQQAERITALQATVADLREEVESRPEISERAVEAVDVLATEFGVGGSDEKYREKLASARERIDDLEQQLATASESAATAPDEYDEFVDDEYVREAIEAAKEHTTPRYVKGVVAGILQRGGPVTQREVATELGIEATHHIKSAMDALADEGVITVTGRGDSREADFDFDGIEALHEQRARQRRTEEVMDGL